MKRYEVNDLLIEMAIREISTQCTFAEVAYKNVIKKGSSSSGLVFTSIHSFLTHCANVSKFLWSEELAKNIEKNKIAEILDVPDSLEIKKRSFRNKLEHYDEHLQKWVKKKKPNTLILDYNMGPKNNIKISGNSIMVRHYDPQNAIFTLLDKDIDLSEIHQEVQEIKLKADVWVRSARRGG